MVDIYDWNDLDAVRDDLTASYTLQNDLDKDTAGYAGIGDAWTPLGFVSDDRNGNPFSGTLDGQGYQISDLVIEENNSTEGGVAFINNLSNGGLIKNLEVDGTVDSTIDDYYYGGLVAYLENNGNSNIQNCASHIDVTAPNGSSVGAFTGRIDGGVDGTVTDCYATGSVDGNEDVAGFTGHLSGNDGSIRRSYAVGSVTGNTGDIGGFIGSGSSVDVNCYWDTQSTGQSTSTGATGLTTSEMQGDEASNTGNMDGFDFTNTWDTVLTEDSDTTADGYPILQALDRANQLQAQGILAQPNPLIVDGVAYDVFVDGTQYSAELQ